MNTELALIPQPQRVRRLPGFFVLPPRGCLAIAHAGLAPAARALRLRFPTWPLQADVPGLPAPLQLRLGHPGRPGGYRLAIGRTGIVVAGADPAGVRHGVQTLLQILDQAPPSRLPRLCIDDWPAIPERGLYFDVSRGRMPNADHLKRLACTLARFKLNQLQLYVEHTFAFRGHPDIGRGADPLTAETILDLDAFCRERDVELIPSLASFGHLASVLHHPRYHSLAEDWGVGRYVTPDAAKRRWLKDWLAKSGYYGFTLSPANPAVYRFLESLYAEFLPLFRSRRFNACCDETVDLGDGQSYRLCRKLGRGRVFLNHLLRLRDLSRRHGKSLMVWGDIIRQHPEIIARIPKDITVLDWGYRADHPFDRIRDFVRAGLSAYACPGTTWFGTPASRANIAGHAAAAARHKAAGFLNTDWEYKFTEVSWPDILFGAEQAWNPKADQATFLARFARVFLNSADARLPGALARLGKIHSQTDPLTHHPIWQTLFFAGPAGPALPAEGRLTARLGRQTLAELDSIRAVLARAQAQRGTDPEAMLPVWLYHVDTMRHAARKLAACGRGGSATPALQAELRREFAALRPRFRALWLERNGPSGLAPTLARYRRARGAGLRFAPKKALTPFVTRFRVSRIRPGCGDLATLGCPGAAAIRRFAPRSFPGPFCDLHQSVFARGPGNGAVFLACALSAPSAMSLALRLGYDGPVKVWVDGTPVFHDPAGSNPARIDAATVPFRAAAGRHAIVIALGSNGGKACGVFCRVERRDLTARQLNADPPRYRMPKAALPA